ncbi:hypothetical protein C8Q77DRAFT_1134959 [Trametes polyzona]|nr:hypothetical protein C8Q77DRAFT_1134959 [Trametes polyzona]
MSFNARLTGSSTPNRGRARGNRGRFLPVSTVKSEDAQPNELLNKRNVSGPPVIRPSAPPLRARGRGFAGPKRNGPRPNTDAGYQRGRPFHGFQSRTNESRRGDHDVAQVAPALQHPTERSSGGELYTPWRGHRTDRAQNPPMAPDQMNMPWSKSTHSASSQTFLDSDRSAFPPFPSPSGPPQAFANRREVPPHLSRTMTAQANASQFEPAHPVPAATSQSTRNPSSSSAPSPPLAPRPSRDAYRRETPPHLARTRIDLHSNADANSYSYTDTHASMSSAVDADAVVAGPSRISSAENGIAPVVSHKHENAAKLLRQFSSVTGELPHALVDDTPPTERSHGTRVHPTPREYTAPTDVKHTIAVSTLPGTTSADAGVSLGDRSRRSPQRSAPPSASVQPLSRRQPPSIKRDVPPHLSLSQSSGTSAESPHHGAPAALWRSAIPSPEPADSKYGDALITGQTNLANPPHPPNSTKATSQTLASASDLLLSDLGKPSSFNMSTVMRRNNEPPPRKRRRVSPPPESSSPSTSVSLPSHASTRSMASHDAQSSAPAMVPSLESSRPSGPETTAAVKRERSPTPAIDDDTNTAPRLVTEGCVRITPLPPECRSARPGYQAARKAWTAREAKKLRDLGVQPTRIFVRDDGMVIDWQSQVPVLPDTLRPPAAAVAPADIIVVDDASPPPTKKQKLQQDDPRAGSGTRDDNMRDVDGCSSPGESCPPDTVQLENMIPAPGQTIWRKVFPPSHSHRSEEPYSTRRSSATHVREACPSPDVVPAASDVDPPATFNAGPEADVIDLTEDYDQPGVDIIDLTEDQVDPELRRDSPERRDVARSRAPNTSHSQTAEESTRPGRGSSSTTDDTRTTANLGKAEASALSFLKRYLSEYAADRAALASAYSRAATFSTQTVPRHYDPPPPVPDSTVRIPPPPEHHRSRLDIVAALLDLPAGDVFAAPAASRNSVEWDVVWAEEAGDVILMCYGTTSRCPAAAPAPQGKGKGKGREKGKGKGKGRAPAGGGVYGTCEQRFVLRRREWDEEDRSTPGVWPLVAVAHQMLFRPLPS